MFSFAPTNSRTYFRVLKINYLRYVFGVSKPEKPSHLSVVPGETHPKQPQLTRDDVAKRLGISVSTVRRYEGTRLEPAITDKGVRLFAVEQVERLAAALAAAQSTPRGMQKAAVNAAQLSKGDLAALVFERLEQRHSLAEIVVALRVPPDDVRELYHAWLIGLCAGELQREEPALPQRHTDQDVVRRVKPDKLARMLRDLPTGEPTRISFARSIGDYCVNDVEYRNVAELGGFVVSGPFDLSQITDRVGGGEHRITAYGVQPSGLRWEVWTTLDEDNHDDSDEDDSDEDDSDENVTR